MTSLSLSDDEALREEQPVQMKDDFALNLDPWKKVCVSCTHPRTAAETNAVQAKLSDDDVALLSERGSFNKAISWGSIA